MNDGESEIAELIVRLARNGWSRASIESELRVNSCFTPDSGLETQQEAREQRRELEAYARGFLGAVEMLVLGLMEEKA